MINSFFKLYYLLSTLLLFSNVFDLCKCEHFFSSMGGSGGLGFAYEFKVCVIESIITIIDLISYQHWYI